MFKRVKRFLRNEAGYTAEAMTWTAILGIGSATMLFGLYSANRFQAGGVGDDLKAIVTPSSIPVATEHVSAVKAGYTGAITGVTIQ